MTTRRAILDFRTQGTGKARSEVVSLSQALDQQKRSAAQLSPALQRLGVVTAAGAGANQTARQGLFGYAQAADRARLSASALNGTILGGAATITAATVGIAALARQAIIAGDTYETLSARVRTFSDGMMSAAQNQRELYDIAGRNRSSVEGLVTLWSRLAPVIREAGRAQADALRITELVSQANLIGGASTTEAQASTVQFGQALASGQLRGDEFRSMSESSPALLRYISQNIEIDGKIGVAYGQLRRLAEEGELTSERIINAVLRAGEAIERDFANAPKTAAQGWQVLQDQITRTVGELAQTSGLQEAVVTWLGDLAFQIDNFRQRAVLDPDFLDPIREATNLIGDGLEGLGQIGQVALEHFDLLMQAGTAVVALKLGQTFAEWFSQGAQMARRMADQISGFVASARFAAGAAMAPHHAEAARQATASAIALEIRQHELLAQAKIKIAQAAAAETAAKQAAARASELAATHGARHTATLAAEAQATRLTEAATRAETQAQAAATAANNAAAAASTRKAVAEAAEAAVTARASTAQTVMNATGRAAVGVYNLLGGALGVATLAIGGLTWAVLEAERAYRNEIAALRDALHISDELEAINRQLAAATWDQVPALNAAAAAHHRRAAAARADAEAQLALIRARRERAEREDPVRRPGGAAGSPYAGFGAITDGLISFFDRRREGDVERELQSARREEFRRGQAAFVSEMTNAWLDRQRREEENRTGRDAAGRPISGDRRSENEREIARLIALGASHLDRLDREVAEQERAIAGASPEGRESLQRGLSVWRESLLAASQLANPNSAGSPAAPAATGGGRRGRQPTIGRDIGRALDALLEQQVRPVEGQPRFSVSGGRVMDATTGEGFRARSQDEARAAREFLEALQAINEATAQEIALTGQSREQLAAAAEARFRDAVATSQASRAQERWAELQAQINGEMNAGARAEAEIAELRRQGADITREAAAAYVELARAQENAARAARTLREVQPLVGEAFENVLAGVRTPTDQYGVPDVGAAAQQLADRRIQIMAEAEALVREEMQRRRQEYALTDEQFERELAERLGAVRLAVEVETGERLMRLRRSAAEASAQIEQDRIDRVAGDVERAMHTFLTTFDLGEAARGLANDFLEILYVELVANPLRLAIQKLLTDLFSPSGGSGGGGSGIANALTNFIMNLFGGGGGVKGKAEGGLIVGPGTGTSDSIMALVGGREPLAVSNGEFIVRADQTRKYLPLLQAINEGRLQGFASGGQVGGHPAPMAPVSGGQAQVNVTLHQVVSVQGSGPEIEALKVELAKQKAELPGSIVRTVREARDRRIV